MAVKVDITFAHWPLEVMTMLLLVLSKLWTGTGEPATQALPWTPYTLNLQVFYLKQTLSLSKGKAEGTYFLGHTHTHTIDKKQGLY
jgi:hypothetical protein